MDNDRYTITGDTRLKVAVSNDQMCRFQLEIGIYIIHVNDV